MREQPTLPQLPLPSTPAAPVMRANAADSIAAAATAQPSRRPSPKRRPARRSHATAIWAFAGLVAAAYAGALLMGQEPITMVAGRWIAQERDNTELAAALARTQTEVAQLQRSVGVLEADMGRVKTQGTQAEARDQATSARIEAVESRVERIGAQIAQVFAKAGPAQKGAQVAAARTGGAAIETGSLPAKEATKEPPATTRELAAARRAPATAEAAAPQGAEPGQSAAILLARGPSLDALRLSWSLLNERHKSALGSLEPRVVTPEPGTHQLIAGPFATSADAAKACATLKSRGVSCQPAEFKGDAL